RDAYPEGCQARRTAGWQSRKFELVIKSEDREGPRIHNCDSSCWHRPMRSSNDDSVAWGPNGDPFARLTAKVRVGASLSPPWDPGRTAGVGGGSSPWRAVTCDGGLCSKL